MFEILTCDFIIIILYFITDIMNKMRTIISKLKTALYSRLNSDAGV